MATKHTPGPWRDAGAMTTGAYPTREDIVIEGPSAQVGVVRKEADARLAIAAPDLVAALEMVRGRVEDVARTLPGSGKTAEDVLRQCATVPIPGHVLAFCLAALRKATGEGA